ncbi:MAG TPA: chemotaxis protein CheD [Longimicrobiales bacterium]|nr:chemotaxis protein CheD [Longimicrobiales bacterium]
MSAPAVASATRRVVVGVGDMSVSNQPGDLLVTYALGSCLGICIHDPVAGVAGMLHAMLPTATADPERAREKPTKFVDSGLTLLFKEAYRLGARKERIVVKVAGGASATPEGRTDSFQIGKRNIVAFRRLLWMNGVLLQAEDVGGNRSRTVSLDVATGEVVITSNGEKTNL